MKAKVLLDSSVWIEILNRGMLSTACENYLNKHEVAGVPAIVIFEVCKKVMSNISEDEALRVAAWLRTYGILPLSDELALHAVDLAIKLKLGMADSMVLAHTYREDAQLVTLDNDFASIKNVVVIS